jgi:putative ABC transport system ATP-binding protein
VAGRTSWRDTPWRTCAGRPGAVRNRQIGFIFQAFNLIGDLTVFENVELPLTYRDMSAVGAERPGAGALERVGMSHRAKHFPMQLSGGQQQRVAVARAVAGDPAILLADEPTGNLDSKNGEAVMALLQELHGGEHDLHGHARPSVCAARGP